MTYGTTDMTDNKAPAVEVRNLAKHYGDFVALKNVNVSIAAGEYFVLLGPSGGGKTTLLRTLGGFHKPTRGEILLHGRNVGHLPPDKRPTTMVFQAYALFPHMTVTQNVGYGLKVAGLSKARIAEKVDYALEQVGLTQFTHRKPHELSGGQQQRVQLARAIVLDRDILLLDEPLAALDAQLRKDMCLELKHLQEKVGITFIHVTHNQEEAMTVADRIALIANGDLVEYGRARDIYRAPQKSFTASFVGENNMLKGKVAQSNGASIVVDVAGAMLQVDKRDLDVSDGQEVTLSIRSECVSLDRANGSAAASDGLSMIGTYDESVYLGLTTSHLAHLPDGTEMVSRVIAGSDDTPPEAGAPVRLSWKPSDIRLHVE
ncbi:ABC transporter ATP-binding protein [Lutimaribacter sp. EGI FJ00015]|uniref:ABC transporter ATP-binding protein n=1 Tax=Lutimaribacter degradans TaxID=2945989 RepID=A0ACC5ZZL1_9RHOB|nr:ABC transporter ATP-binding protein [Lutimaribacter sp. EGI FJ00013]MCM2562974.1 ABC transporter ATP-binding protein [Lutimaribacter sp. EGI FJ00013]MCO0614142.1 ABC transporter ATP-binding protein [Lutimaribacter sp. EGI FJ00015]MCO0636119.1 ABC transporter ATP-binding protein [Lutimaribacter sp. EGI FJ00014]